ncbi:phenylalanyl-tRNA synthetase subunit beta [Tateyamaria armeniaca]|uniref:Phenylalanyl-tRNA synthetase subunit beta n=1 Tax=Tateyamaria armeniaca TaxID=2518930 RepID=A0ABW8UVV9_9RHOB
MKYYLVAIMVALIIIAHVFLWLSDMEPGLILTFTILNAIGWSIVFLPILFIDRWLDAIKRRNNSDHDNLT